MDLKFKIKQSFFFGEKISWRLEVSLASKSGNFSALFSTWVRGIFLFCSTYNHFKRKIAACILGHFKSRLSQISCKSAQFRHHSRTCWRTGLISHRMPFKTLIFCNFSPSTWLVNLVLEFEKKKFAELSSSGWRLNKEKSFLLTC